MGDFNINPHNRKLSYKTHNNINKNDEISDDEDIEMEDTDSDIPRHYYHKRILNTLKEHYFKDLIKIYITTPPPTYHNSQNHSSYIDIIFGSPNFINYISFGNILDAPIDTDHKLIYVSINNKFITNNNNYISNTNNIIELNKKKNISSTEKLNYKKITTEQWTDFHNFVWDEYTRNKPNVTQFNNTQAFLNATYDNFTQSINRTIKSLNFPKIKINSHQYEYTHDIRVIQNDIYYILKIIKLSTLYFSVNNNTKYLPLLNFWTNPKKLNRLKRISSNPKIKTSITQDDQDITWPPILNHNNFPHILEIMKTIHNVLKTLYDDEINHMIKTSPYARDDDIPIMGYGWIFSSDLKANIKFSGSCKEWASSTKAELMAILTTLIIGNTPNYGSNIIHFQNQHVNNIQNTLAGELNVLATPYQHWTYSTEIIPAFLQGFETCFLCSSAKETNEHLWNCPRVLAIITPIFTDYYTKYKALITSESNSVYALYSDSITRNPVFKWTKKPPQQIKDIPELHCLLRNFIPSSLTYPFKAATISKDNIKKILLKFIFDLHKDIYEHIWKYRSIAWKEFKTTHNINKKSFTNYRQTHHRDPINRRRQFDYNNIHRDNGYHCPLNDSRRHTENNNLWIYLTSSNFLHNLPWLSSLNDDLSNSYFNIFNNIFLFHI
ncbi:hypothetical protein RhiirA4_469090 [Rhizophagus irregularis]|uniref:Uncharacterized protein n=1 Tax=Rhizophagus irregularis TaxID=588596 RepID=A0A2I1GYW5_9GLOM|nr:hypothetical protein RhiirA4_469090 [Rhizophagus irregularis]